MLARPCSLHGQRLDPKGSPLQRTDRAGLEISKLFGNQFSVPCIRFMGNCRKPLFGSVNFDHENLFFFIKETVKVGLDSYNKYTFSKQTVRTFGY